MHEWPGIGYRSYVNVFRPRRLVLLALGVGRHQPPLCFTIVGIARGESLCSQGLHVEDLPTTGMFRFPVPSHTWVPSWTASMASMEGVLPTLVHVSRLSHHARVNAHDEAWRFTASQVIVKLGSHAWALKEHCTKGVVRTSPSWSS